MAPIDGTILNIKHPQIPDDNMSKAQPSKANGLGGVHLLGSDQDCKDVLGSDLDCKDLLGSDLGFHCPPHADLYQVPPT